MAFKCWKKVGYASSGGAYERKNSNGSRRIVIDKHEGKHQVITQVWNPRFGRNDSVLRESKKKSVALKFAMSYMKKHDRC